MDNIDKPLNKLTSSDQTVKSLDIKVKYKRKKISQLNNSSDDLPWFGIKKNTFKRKTCSDSFRKYGISLPSVEELIADEKNLNKDKNQLLKVEKILKRQLVSCPSPEKTSRSSVVWLDCKHLTLDDISEYFFTKMKYLRDILTGRINCVRHKIFCTKMSSNELTHNTSMIVFSFNQIEHIVTLMEKEFNMDKVCQKGKLVSHINKDYFFKVLIPVFCLEIFMDKHKMSKQKAIAYLNKRPIE